MIEKSGLLDTSVIIAISVAELHSGIHVSPTAESRSIRMATLEAIAGLTLLGIDGTAASHWGPLRYPLAAAGRKVNVNDLWIESIALANSLPVVTQDRDFDLFTDLGGPVVIHV